MPVAQRRQRRFEGVCEPAAGPGPVEHLAFHHRPVDPVGVERVVAQQAKGLDGAGDGVSTHATIMQSAEPVPPFE
ncbi:MAG TPA: hypothetical protein VG317_08725 [Pseudonocardiaceae bacterium]|nr:hypothetical protein [Pseudonocardiaceae bacterium]